MGRYQRGHIYKASDSFFVRYYVSEIVDGKPVRAQRSYRLCSKDDKYHSTKCKPVKQLAAEHMDIVNAQTAPMNEQTVVAFWERVYLPFAEENLRHSTVHGYKQIWGQHLSQHFEGLALKEYRTHMGSLFLTGLAKTLGRHTLQHIRSLASGIFSHAVNVGAIESNPWHDVKVLGKTRAPEDTRHYTLEEAENIISALVDHVDCQCVVALAFFVGLRPGEIQGLRWEDIDLARNSTSSGGWIHIRRAVVRNRVGETKTDASVASLPLITPVSIPLALWWQKSNSPTEGWVFPNSRGKSTDLKSLTARVIVPALTAKGIEWKTLYAGRRGAATILTQLTGDALAAKELLRHKNLAVTTDKYVKAIPEALLRGIKLLEAAANGKG